jgi:hypothetical protein
MLDGIDQYGMLTFSSVMVSLDNASRVASTTIFAFAPLSLSECARTIAPVFRINIWLIKLIYILADLEGRHR